MRSNKRGFIRVVEATVAVILILTTLIFLSAQKEYAPPEDIGKPLPSLIDEIARNKTIRQNIIENDSILLENEISLSLSTRLNNPSLNISVQLCNATDVCFLEPYPDTESEIYSYERIISADVENETFNPKKIKVYLWRNSA